MGEKELLSLDLFSVIHEYQRENGLAYDDYMRYRQYLTRRLKRIRKNKSVNFTHHGPGYKYTSRDIVQELTGEKQVLEEISETEVEASAKDSSEKLCASSLHLQIPLVQAERAWSLSMQLKQEMEADGKDNGVRAHHMRQRLKKAGGWSTKLREVCEMLADQKTILEAQTYESIMKGNFQIEKDDLESAIVSFSRVSSLLERLLNVCSVKEVEILEKRKEHADFLLVYCRRYLSQEGIDPDSLLQAENEAVAQIDAKLKKLSDERMKKTFERTKVTISVAKDIIPVTDENAALKVMTFQNAETTLADVLEKKGASLDDDSSWKIIDAKFTDVLSSLEDIKSAYSVNEDPLKAKLTDFVKMKRSEIMLRKNITFLRRMISLSLTMKQDQIEAENIVRLCDRTGSQKESVSEDEILELKIYKAFYLALFYTKSPQSSEGLVSAVQLLNLCLNLIQDFKRICNIGEVPSSLVTSIEQRSRKQKCIYIGLIGLEKEGAREEVEEMHPTKTVAEVEGKLLPAKPFFFDLVLEKLRPELMDLSSSSSKVKAKNQVEIKQEKPIEANSPQEGAKPGDRGWFSGWFNNNSKK